MTALDLPLVPAGQYRLDIMIYFVDKLIILVQGYATVKARGAAIL